MGELQELTLANIGGGVVPELFGRELAEVLKNIDDPNTEAKKKRTIVLEIEISPAESREVAHILVKCKSKLAPVSPAVALTYFGKKGSALHAYTADPRQTRLSFDKPAVIEGGRSAEKLS